MKKPAIRKQANDNTASLRAEADLELRRKFSSVYDTAEGKFVLEYIMHNLCRHGQNVITDGNPVNMYINSARHDVGNDIRKLIHEKVNDGNANN